MKLSGERKSLLRLLVWAGAAAWAAFLTLSLWPAWQARSEVVATLAQRRQQLASQRQMTASIPAAEERLAKARAVVLARESEMVETVADTDLIRQIQATAGPGVAVTTLTAGQRRNVKPAQAAQKSAASAASVSPYWQVPSRVEAIAGLDSLTAFLSGLESRVPGLRVEGVQLEGGRGSATGWRLVATGSVFLVQTPLSTEEAGN